MPLTVSLAVLPAASSAPPVAGCPAPSKRLTGSAQATTPDRLSSQAKATVTGVLYQPFPLGALDAAPVIDGSVASRLIDTLVGPADPPALVAEQEYVVSSWSAVVF